MFRVTGRDAQGQSRELRVFAATEEEARAIAQGDGLVTIERVGRSAPSRGWPSWLFDAGLTVCILGIGLLVSYWFASRQRRGAGTPEFFDLLMPLGPFLILALAAGWPRKRPSSRAPLIVALVVVGLIGVRVAAGAPYEGWNGVGAALMIQAEYVVAVVAGVIDLGCRVVVWQQARAGETT